MGAEVFRSHNPCEAFLSVQSNQEDVVSCCSKLFLIVIVGEFLGGKED